MHPCWDFDASEIEAQVHYIVSILARKVNTQLLI